MIWLLLTDLSRTSCKNATIAARAKDLLRFEPHYATPSRGRLAAVHHEPLSARHAIRTGYSSAPPANIFTSSPTDGHKSGVKP
jgi:hypothetical protein